MLERDTAGDLLFPIANQAISRYQYAGFLPNGRQTLIGCNRSGRMEMVVFDAAGNLLEYLQRDLPSPRELLESGYTEAAHDDDYHNFLERELGVSFGTIRVHAFALPQHLLAVYHLPKHYQAFLKNPKDERFDELDREERPRLIQFWLDQGQFVLEWGNDYWLDSNGECVAS